MNHKVLKVQELSDDAFALYNNVVVGGNDTSADSIINNLSQGINSLKNSWEGKDAGIQIQNVIDVYNALISIRNVLGQLSVDSSKIAKDYREIQNSNGAGSESLGTLSCESRTVMENYSDVRDTININSEANTGKTKIDAANSSFDGFITEVTKYYNLIMDNWLQGPGRDNAKESFEAFLAKSNSYKGTLSEVSSSIATALQNYSL